MKTTAIIFYSLIISVLLPVNYLYAKHRPPILKNNTPHADIKNLHEFSRNIYRGSQPSKEGFDKLKKMGVKTIIDLEPGHSDAKLIDGLGFAYFQIPVKLWHVQDKDLIQFLKIITNTKYYPVFIHCDNGLERASLMVAIYRVYAQNWTTYDATKEFCKTEQKKYWKVVEDCLDSIDKDKIKEAIKL